MILFYGGAEAERRRKVAAKAEGVRSHVDSSCIERLLI